jgi:hypothetical protein
METLDTSSVGFWVFRFIFSLIFLGWYKKAGNDQQYTNQDVENWQFSSGPPEENPICDIFYWNNDAD